MHIENKRYQVFISSTFNDLKQERAEVTHALLELDCIPCGMEAFPAANDTQWNWIKRVIEECDYYVLIVGGKYGSVNDETGLSYTEMEYNHAIENSVPAIAFIIQDEGKILGDKLETDPEKIKKLKNFKEMVKKKLCKFYTTPEDLSAKVSRAITQLKKTDPRIGWVRADSLRNYSSHEEVINLMKENEELKRKLDENNPFGLKSNILAKGDEVYNLEYSCLEDLLDKVPNSPLKVTWDELFFVIGCKFYRNTYLDTNEIKDILNSLIIQKLKRFGDTIDITENCLTQILVQFESLGYIDDAGGSWCFTKKGKEYFSYITSVKGIEL